MASRAKENDKLSRTPIFTTHCGNPKEILKRLEQMLKEK